MSRYPDRTADPSKGPLLGSPNRLKLAVFCANTQRGTTTSFAEETLKLTWPESLAIVKAVEDAGIEAIIPLARWRKPKFTAPEVDRIFETFTWASAVAASTRRVQVFATVHMALIHPVLAAKFAATIDHISGGRFAMNVVAGWNAADFAMFGMTLREHEDRYAVAAEWMDLVQRIWAEDQPFDFNGTYYQGRGIVSQPKPIQAPRIPFMSAGSSPAGLKFARQWADINFAVVEHLEDTPKIVADTRAAAASTGRHIGVYTSAWIVCRDTEQEARDYVEEVIHQKGDFEQGNSVVAEMIKHSLSTDVFARKAIEVRSMSGFFALPLVGTADQIVEKLRFVADAGIDGLAISWPDYDLGLRQYREQLLPRMIAAGLRVS